MCLASWATELATHSEAIRATITANGAAPPAKENPSGIEKAVAMAGAMNVIDWKRIPPNPTAPRLSSCGCPAAPGPGTGGTPTVAMSNLPGPLVAELCTVGLHSVDGPSLSSTPPRPGTLGRRDALHGAGRLFVPGGVHR